MGETVHAMFPAEKIDRRLSELAEEIRSDYGEKLITMVCALKGATIFMADLARKLDNNVEFEFLRASSYGDASVSDGNVRLMQGTIEPLEGKHVLLVEDIVDSGHTLVFLRNYIESQKPASFKICVLLDKPERRVDGNAAYDYLGFSIPDEFMVGYGLDYAQRYRNLPFLGVLRFE